MTSMSRSSSHAGSAPHRAGLYDPAYEHDGCGIGFIAQIHGVRSHDIVRDALELLANLSHRSAVGCDPCTGDGAGILLQVPHAFLRSCTRQEGISLPELGEYGVGMLFLPADGGERARCERIVEDAIHAQGCRVLGWRDVPTDPSALGEIARSCRPVVRQVFVSPGGIALDVDDAMAFERMLFIVRKRIERDAPAGLYVASLSSRTIIYKGMLRPGQLPLFYGDLTDERLASAIALVHSRFSTNTLPTWPRAHPYRYICHNGEINTIRGNTDWMRVREEQMSSARFGADVELLFPVIGADQSDSACLDNAVELLVMSGRPLSHAMAMLIPEAWEKDAAMPPARRAFYEYHAPLMEPWDGPAAVAFTDGRQIGAMLDRNGLRPARYVLTDDDRVVLASEAGALAIPPGQIRSKGRLEPGRMLIVNTTQGKVLDDEAVKAELVSLRPYNRLVAEHKLSLGEPATGAVRPHGDAIPLTVRQRIFGYTTEERRVILAPMGAAGEEPAGSMGNDAPLAVLSRRPQLLYAYFKQLFAQVTNPAIDPIREQLVMSLRIPLGAKGNLLDEMPDLGAQLWLDRPVLDEREFASLQAVEAPSLRCLTLDARFRASDRAGALARTLDDLCERAAAAAREGYGVLVISDRNVDSEWAPLPSLLAVGAVHHHLIREKLRSRVSLVVETGDARQVSHVALLLACGASAVHPYLALDTISELAALGDMLPLTDADDARHNYVKAIDKGLLKILSKMGISTLQSYCGAQICETVGLDRALVDRYFTGTAARLSGVGLEQIAEEVLARHAAAFDSVGLHATDVGGDIHFRIQGEQHAWNPASIAALQHATRTNDAATFAEFSRIANDEARSGGTLRGLLDLVDGDPVPLGEVEPASAIVRRFVTGAMSFGSISAEAHETIAIAMNRLGGRSNTGEGGEDRARFGTDRSSAIKQVASARFGVTTEYLVNAAELQIKIAQGAKPGEGGQLPGHKVDAIIARTRHSTPGVTLISPPPHHDIYSIEDLAQLIHDLAHVNPRAAISVKLVAEAGVGTIAAGVAKARADLITISGDSGGTGASPLSSIKNAGVPWELGLAEAQQTLVMNGLRGRVRLQTDGQLKTGRDVLVAALLGAEEFGFATAPLIVEGCVMMRKCHLNTCPVGIATQDPVLRAKFNGRPEHLVNYFFFVAEEVRALLARLGARTLDEVIGRADLLRPSPSLAGKARTLDLEPLLHLATPAYPASFGASDARRCVETQDHGREGALDRELLSLAAPALERGEAVSASMPVRTADRAVGTMLSGEIARRFGAEGLRDGAITFRFTGSAGQSFGAFGASGLTMELEGEANDYVGKGLSGARLIVRAPRQAQYLPDDAVIVGNTVLYGATSGEAYFGGVAGERFAVRNSGALAVVEGVGDHGCEYMTGGAVVVLGRTGRNFAAGMSGGVAFVLDEEGQFAKRCNSAQVELEPVGDAEDRALLKRLVEQHARYTGSARARHLLARWPNAIQRFVTVMPVEYKRARTEAARVARAGQALYG